MAKFKRVPPEVLRAFGFKKLRKKNPGFPAATHYHSELDIFYTPSINSINTFADNLMNGVFFKTIKNINQECDRLRPKVR